MVRDFLRHDESRDARSLLTRLAEDRSTSDMMITLADCLKEYPCTGITGMSSANRFGCTPRADAPAFPHCPAPRLRVRLPSLLFRVQEVPSRRCRPPLLSGKLAAAV